VANKRYFIDGDSNTRTLYDSTAANQYILQDNEQGLDALDSEHIIEPTANLYASRYRTTAYTPRLVSATYRLYPDTRTPAGLEAIRKTWVNWHATRRGMGQLKIISHGGDTRILDCIPMKPEFIDRNVIVETVNQQYIGPNPFFRTETPTTVNAGMNTAIAVTNGDFAAITGTEDDGTSDTLDNWTNDGVDDPSGDKVEATATAQAGDYAAMLTYATAQTSIQSAAITVIPGETIKLSFYTRGDATEQGQFLVYDITNAADIVALSDTGVTAATYAVVTSSFVVPTDCVSLYIKFHAPNAAGVAYFDTVTLMRTSLLASCLVAGDVPSWPVITITGICNTPRVTNSDSEYIETSGASVNADDTIVFDCRPGYRGIKYYENGAGSGTPWPFPSGAKFITLPVGTYNLTLTATSGVVTAAVVYYAYYEGAF